MATIGMGGRAAKTDSLIKLGHKVVGRHRLSQHADTSSYAALRSREAQPIRLMMLAGLAATAATAIDGAVPIGSGTHLQVFAIGTAQVHTRISPIHINKRGRIIREASFSWQVGCGARRDAAAAGSTWPGRPTVIKASRGWGSFWIIWWGLPLLLLP